MTGMGIRERHLFTAGDNLANLKRTLSTVMDSVDTDLEEVTRISLKAVCLSPSSIVRISPTRSFGKLIRPESSFHKETGTATGGRYLVAGTPPKDKFKRANLTGCYRMERVKKSGSNRT